MCGDNSILYMQIPGIPKPFDSFAYVRRKKHKHITDFWHKIARFTIQRKDDGHFVVPSAIQLASNRERLIHRCSPAKGAWGRQTCRRISVWLCAKWVFPYTPKMATLSGDILNLDDDDDDDDCHGLWGLSDHRSCWARRCWGWKLAASRQRAEDDVLQLGLGEVNKVFQDSIDDVPSVVSKVFNFSIFFFW